MKRWTFAALAILGLTAPSSVARAEFPTLERTIQLAQARAIVVGDARAELGVANAQLTGASVSIFGNPYTEAQFDKGFGGPLGGSAQYFQALTYTYFPIDITGQRGARIDEAQKLIEWRKVGLLDARAIAAGTAASAYGAMVLGSARLSQATTGEQTSREEARYFAGRLEAKDTTIYEKALADAEVARWVQSRAEAELRMTQARAELGQLMGAPVVEMPPEDAPPAPPALKAAWDDAYVAHVIAKTPLIARLQAERGYWDASVDRYKAERIPPFLPEIIAGRGAAGETRFGAGLVFTFPITRRFQGEIARAENGREVATSRLAIYRNIVDTRLRAARDALATVRKTMEELDKNGIPALEKAVSASVEAFKLGKMELTRVLLARRDLAIARARRLDLIEAGWRAYADLTIFSGELP